VKALLARKIGMTSTITDDGTVAAVTLLSAPANIVTQIKNQEADGYSAVQVGFEEAKSLGKSLKGHVKSSKASPKVIREIMTGDVGELKVGDNINVDLFDSGDIVHATGTSKGKGFAGTIKRHNFALGRKTHGGSSYRRPGSIGSMYPQKIFKGKRMAGQMGAEQVTTRNLKVALINAEENVIGVYGSIPGPRKSIVILRSAK